jgi:sulfur carrier protein
MKVTVNGDETDLAAGATVRTVLDGLELPGEGRGVAVAVDAEVVPRAAWDETELHDGAQIEILRAIQGG